MKPIRKAKNKILSLLFSSVLQNTLFTIAITAAITAYFSSDAGQELISRHWNILVGIIVLAWAIYQIMSHERVLMFVQNTPDNNPWAPSDSRLSHFALLTRKELLVQFSDLPLLHRFKLPDSYSLEFEAKVIDTCFAWCLNMDKEASTGYMIQYDPQTRKLRPHFLIGKKLEGASFTSTWVTPGEGSSPLKEISVDLMTKNGFYSVRTEVRLHQSLVSVDGKQRPTTSALLWDQDGKEVPVSGKQDVIEITVFDLNNFSKECCRLFYTEPPFKVFTGSQFGFRNFGFETAIYKNVIVKQL